jgi:putative DNA base modification enzyme with NMAD domain
MRARIAESRPLSRVYTYVLAADGGFAPNPFHGWCTLACCKPKIRKRARVGDWVVGLTPARDGSRVAYAMQVQEVLPFAAYWADKRFRRKRPRWTAQVTVQRCGDNCYEPTSDDGFRQHPSGHYDHRRGREQPRAKARDLGGLHVLVSHRFAYYGEKAIGLPEHLSFAIPGRGHRVRFTPEERDQLLAFVRVLPRGRHGLPKRFVEDGGRLGRARGGRCAQTSLAGVARC